MPVSSPEKLWFSSWVLPGHGETVKADVPAEDNGRHHEDKVYEYHL